MNFDQVFEANLLEDWRDYYINYNDLKQCVDNLQNGQEIKQYSHYDKYIGCKKTSNEKLLINNSYRELQSITDYSDKNELSKLINELKKLLNVEITKVNDFYIQIEKLLLKQFNEITLNLKLTQQQLMKLKRRNKSKRKSIINFHSDTFIDNDTNLSLLTSTSPVISPASSPSLSNISLSKALLEDDNDEKDVIAIPKSYHSGNQHLYQLKLSVFSLYEQFMILNNFIILNHMALHNICNQFNKTLNIKDTLTEIKLSNIVSNDIEIFGDDSNKLNKYVNILIELYSNLYENGNFDAGKVRILNSINKTDKINKSPNSDFLIGYKIGLICGGIGWCLSSLISNINDDSTFHLLPHALYVYRCIAAFIFWIYLWSFCLYIWNKYRINWAFILELNRLNHLNYYQFLTEAINLSIMYLLNLIIYIRIDQLYGADYAVILPSSLLIYMILRFILPIPFKYWKSRKYLLYAMYNTIIAPFGNVTFHTFLIGDIMTSMVRILVDFYLSICSLLLNEFKQSKMEQGYCMKYEPISTSIIICVPFWLMFMHCLHLYFVTGDRFPHLPNAAKYSLTMTVTLLGTIHGAQYNDANVNRSWDFDRCLWLVITIIDTAYLLIWDFVLDCNLFDKLKKMKGIHSNETLLIYPNFLYISIAILDIFLRYLWTFTLFPSNVNPYFNTEIPMEYFLIFVEFAELFRRGIWMIIFFETIHNKQLKKFRNYVHIPVMSHKHRMKDNTTNKTNQNRKTSIKLMEMIILILVVIFVSVYIWIT